MGAIMATSTGEQATRKVTKQILDAQGHIEAHCEIANAPQRQKQQDDELRLAASLAEVAAI